MGTFTQPVREPNHEAGDQGADRPARDWPGVRLLLNRILLSLCVALSLVMVLLAFSPIAGPVLAIIGMLTTLITYLFPGVRRIHQKSWFSGRWASTAFIVIIVILGGVDGYLFLSSGEEDELRITRVEGDEAGQCGAYCTVSVEGQHVSKLVSGQRLVVYGPYARLVGGSWSETPIAVLRVLDAEDQIALAQVLLVHDSADIDDSKRVMPGERVVSETRFATDFLVPAFGDGYVYRENVVYLRPGTVAQVGDRLVTLEPQVLGQRIIDHLLGETELEVVAVGQEGISVQTRLDAGPPPQEGDIVWLERVHSTQEK